MKRFLIIAISLLIVFSAFPVTVFADIENYDAVMFAPDKAMPGDTVNVSVSVQHIDVLDGTYSNGIFSTAFTLIFDPNVFEPVNYTATIPEKWEHFDRQVDFAEGKWTAFAVWDDGPLNGVTEDNKIIIVYQLKVIGFPSDGTTTLRISDVQGSNGSMKLFYGTGSEATVSIEAFMPKPDSGLRLDKDKNTIVSAVNNVKASDFAKLFLCDPSKISVNGTDGAISPDSLVATGMTVTDGIDTYTVIIKGDVDLDGKVTQNDYAAVKAHLKADAALSGLALSAADTDENGMILTSDYMMIRRSIAGNYKFSV